MVLSHDDRPWAFGSFTLEVRRGWALSPWYASWESCICPSTVDGAQPSWLSNTCCSWRSLLDSQALLEARIWPYAKEMKGRSPSRIASKAPFDRRGAGSSELESETVLFCGPLPSSSFSTCHCPQTSVHSWESSVWKLTKSCKFLSSRKKLTFLSLNATQRGMVSRKPERTLSV